MTDRYCAGTGAQHATHFPPPFLFFWLQYNVSKSLSESCVFNSEEIARKEVETSVTEGEREKLNDCSAFCLFSNRVVRGWGRWDREDRSQYMQESKGRLTWVIRRGGFFCGVRRRRAPHHTRDRHLTLVITSVTIVIPAVVEIVVEICCQRCIDAPVGRGAATAIARAKPTMVCSSGTATVVVGKACGTLDRRQRREHRVGRGPALRIDGHHCVHQRQQPRRGGPAAEALTHGCRVEHSILPPTPLPLLLLLLLLLLVRVMLMAAGFLTTAAVVSDLLAHRRWEVTPTASIRGGCGGGCGGARGGPPDTTSDNTGHRIISTTTTTAVLVFAVATTILMLLMIVIAEILNIAEGSITAAVAMVAVLAAHESIGEWQRLSSSCGEAVACVVANTPKHTLIAAGGEGCEPLLILTQTATPPLVLVVLLSLRGVQ